MRNWVRPYRAQHLAVTGMFAVRIEVVVNYRKSRCRCCSCVGQSCLDTTGRSPGVHSCYCARSGRRLVGQNCRWMTGPRSVIRLWCYSCPWWLHCQTAGRCVNEVCLNAECSLGCLLQTLSSCSPIWQTHHSQHRHTAQQSQFPLSDSVQSYHCSNHDTASTATTQSLLLLSTVQSPVLLILVSILSSGSEKNLVIGT